MHKQPAYLISNYGRIKMETLILAEGSLTPVCSKTHITYTFNLQKEAKRLNIDFSYAPKILEDRPKAKELICEGINEYILEDQRDGFMRNWDSFLPVQNLLTISIDYYDEFRGCAHRHPNEQHIYIAENDATPGFIAGKIAPGQWKVTISAHAVVTDICRYKLHIWEGEL
jgi:hypothetical protein